MKKLICTGIIAIAFSTPPIYASDNVSYEDPCAKEPAQHEMQFRIAPNFGLLFELDQVVTDYGVKRFVLIQPEANFSVQIYGRWFASISFDYAQARTKITGGNVKMFAYTAGIKAVTWEYQPLSSDFFDGSRWWLGFEMGDYITHAGIDVGGGLEVALTEGNEFGLNVSTGFDYFFHDNWGTGMQVKMHYVDYSPDDYIFLTFGPYLILRF